MRCEWVGLPVLALPASRGSLEPPSPQSQYHTSCVRACACASVCVCIRFCHASLIKTLGIGCTLIQYGPILTNYICERIMPDSLSKAAPTGKGIGISTYGNKIQLSSL